MRRDQRPALHPCAHRAANALAAFPALAGFDVHAGDGHFHAHATHDPLDHKGGHHATGHLYSRNLRSGCLSHLAVNDQQERKKEHEMRALKRMDIAALRQGAPKGRKVLYVWDRDGIDFVQWHKWKQDSGIYMLSRCKTNLVLLPCGDLRFDGGDEINAGVLSDELVGTATSGSMLRRITFHDGVGDRLHGVPPVRRFSAAVQACSKRRTSSLAMRLPSRPGCAVFKIVPRLVPKATPASFNCRAASASVSGAVAWALCVAEVLTSSATRLQKPAIAPGSLVFLDESGAKTNMTRLRGGAPRGRRLHAAAPCGRWQSTTNDLLHSARWHHGLHAPGWSKWCQPEIDLLLAYIGEKADVFRDAVVIEPR